MMTTNPHLQPGAPNTPQSSACAKWLKLILGGAIIFAVLACLSYRITIGVDLSDEAYYATYIDGWLKLGLKNGQNLNLHQTSEFLLFPFAYAYKSLHGDEQGLILFLRCIYLGLALAAGLCLYRLIAMLRGNLVAGLASIYMLFFVPFSLPA